MDIILLVLIGAYGLIIAGAIITKDWETVFIGIVGPIVFLGILISIGGMVDSMESRIAEKVTDRIIQP